MAYSSCEEKILGRQGIKSLLTLKNMVGSFQSFFERGANPEGNYPEISLFTNKVIYDDKQRMYIDIDKEYIPKFLVYIDAVLVLITIEDLLGGEPSYEELENFLADRWSVIQGLFFDYTHNPASPLTELCYAIAKYLESHEENREKKIAYQFLMPTLKAYINLVDDERSLNKLALDQFMVFEAEGGHYGFSLHTLADYLEAGNDKQAQECALLYPYIARADDEIPRTALEAMKTHSKEAKYLHEMYALVQENTKFGSPRAMLQNFAEILTANGQGTTGDKHATEGAYKALIEMNQYISSLPRAKRETLRSLRCEYGSNYGSNCKFGPDVMDVLNSKTKAITCVEMAANKIFSILNNYENKKFLDDGNLTNLNNLETAKKTFNACLDEERTITFHVRSFKNPNIHSFQIAYLAYFQFIKLSEHESNLKISKFKDISLLKKTLLHVIFQLGFKASYREKCIGLVQTLNTLYPQQVLDFLLEYTQVPLDQKYTVFRAAGLSLPEVCRHRFMQQALNSKNANALNELYKDFPDFWRGLDAAYLYRIALICVAKDAQDLLEVTIKINCDLKLEQLVDLILCSIELKNLKALTLFLDKLRFFYVAQQVSNHYIDKFVKACLKSKNIDVLREIHTHFLELMQHLNKQQAIDFSRLCITKHEQDLFKTILLICASFDSFRDEIMQLIYLSIKEKNWESFCVLLKLDDIEYIFTAICLNITATEAENLLFGLAEQNKPELLSNFLVILSRANFSVGPGVSIFLGLSHFPDSGLQPIISKISFQRLHKNETLLTKAIKDKAIDIISVLLKAGANDLLFTFNAEYKTPMYVAIEEDNYEAVELLLKAHIDNVEDRDFLPKERLTALQKTKPNCGSRVAHLQGIKRLCKTANAQNQEAFQNLFDATYQHNFMLLKKEDMLNYIDQPLYWAVCERRLVSFGESRKALIAKLDEKIKEVNYNPLFNDNVPRRQLYFDLKNRLLTHTSVAASSILEAWVEEIKMAPNHTSQTIFSFFSNSSTSGNTSCLEWAEEQQSSFSNK